MGKSQKKPEAKRKQKWEVPQEGSLKLNVNASVFPGESSFAVGIVLRDLVASLCKQRQRH